MEFIWHALFHPETLDMDAFILYTHSRAFHIALLLSLIEFIIESIFWPYLKYFNLLHLFGLIMIIFGQIVRSLAMFTAGSNFTHLVATEKINSHQLITHGIYRYSRHPAYCGWFWWSIGTQILLANPISIIGFAVASWSFFAERIPYEERHLTDFFGQQYIDYKKCTPVGIPFLEK